MADDITTVLARRGDLAGFIVHLTRDTDDPKASASDNLKSIVSSRTIAARTAMGLAASKLNAGAGLDSQTVVCFTETPLDMIKHLAVEVDGRQRQFKPYGIAIPRTVARQRNVNPVWYIDTTSPGGTFRDYLSPHVSALVAEALNSGKPFQECPIAHLAPYFETMGVNQWGRKEFWWEREWRHRGDFSLPLRYIGLCPEGEIAGFEALALKHGGVVCRFVDPMWPLDRMIGEFAGFAADDLRSV